LVVQYIDEIYFSIYRQIYLIIFQLCSIEMNSRAEFSDVERDRIKVAFGGSKNWHTFCTTSHALTSSNIDRFSNLFHYLNQENICNNTITKDPTTPQIWNVCVLNATIENKTTSLTTHFKKLTTGNNVFIVSVII